MGLFKKNNPIDLSAFNPNTRRGDSRVKSNIVYTICARTWYTHYNPER